MKRHGVMKRNGFLGHAGRRRARWSLAVLLGAAMTSSAFGKAVIRLEPTPAGPYSPGQNVTVDIYVDNQEHFALPLASLRLDFADTSPGLVLPAALSWQLTPPTAGDPILPRPVWTEPSAAPGNTVPAQGSLLVATIQVTLPSVAGCYALDVMNRDESSSSLGAQLGYLPAPGAATVVWRAYHGQLLDGAEGFPISVSTSAEVCNGLDDDCDGLVDEDFAVESYNPFVDEVVLVGEGAPCAVGTGDCESEGTYQCNRPRTALECNAPPPPSPGVEGPNGTSTCYDLHDNDCDGLVDWEDPNCTGAEICDYVDNDNNGVVDDPFPLLGQPCTVGEGVCAATGVWVCNRTGTGVECSAQPLPTNNELEGPPDHPRCSDGLDNDCDGRVDLEDPDCLEPERCDGKDNNGDGKVDELWPDLGDPCTVGVGTCERTGVRECNAAGTATQCSVTPGAPTPEGPGCDCADTLDNDCDGLIDLGDPDCGAFIFRAEASLPQICDVEGDCATWRRINYDTLNGGPNVSVQADIVAMDTNGQVLGTRAVTQGQVVHFVSRGNPADFAITPVLVGLNSESRIAAWMNCTHGPGQSVAGTSCEPFDTDCDDDVDLRDAAVLTELFPNSIRYVEVVAPLAVLRVRADNGYARVTAYASPLPHVHVWHPDDSTVILNEGDRVLADIAVPEIDPATLGLKLDGVDVFAALGINPATDLPGGPFGGSIPLPNGCTAEICELIVDAADSLTPSANSIRLVAEGMCCGGHLFHVSGQPRPDSWLPDPLPPVCAADDGQDSGVSHGFEIAILAPADGAVDPAAPVNVVGTVCHGIPLADPPNAPTTVDLNGQPFGTNPPAITIGDGVNTANRYSYAFSAALPETNLFQDFIGTGGPGTVDPGSSYLVAGVTDRERNATYDRHKLGLGPLVAPASLRDTASGVPHGLTLALTDTALETVVQRAINALIPVLTQELLNMTKDLQGTKFTVPTDGPCDPQATVFPNIFPPPIFIPPNVNNFVIDVVPSNDRVDVTITVPQTRAIGSIFGRCEIEGIFGECFIEITVLVTLDVKINKATLRFGATEADLITGNPIVPTLEILQQDLDISIVDAGSDVGCWGGVLAQILSFGVFGVVVDAYVEGELNDFINDIDPQDYLGMIPVPPIPLDFLDIDPIDLAALDVTLALRRTEVEITPSGMAVGLETEFIPKQIDPEVEIMPGLPNSQASLPQPPLGAPALGATLLVSDDAVNQMLNALTRNGLIKTEYEDVQLLSGLLPGNCATLPPSEQGQCVALKGQSCGLLSGDALVTCLATEVVLDQLSLQSSTPIILHGRLDASPKFYLFRNPNPSTLVAYYRMSAVQVGVIADRDGDGSVSVAYGAIPSCFGDNPGTATSCLLWTGCFDVNVALQLTLSAPPGQTPEISFNVINVELSDAVGCGGGTGFPAGLDGLEDVFADQVFQLLNSQVSSVPPLELEGLDFGNIVNLLNLRVLDHGNENDLVFEDYFGITADPN